MLKKRAFRIFIYFAAVLLVIWSLAPIAWMVISSITPSNQMVQSERILPDNFTVERYKMVLFGQQIEGVNRNAAAQSAVFRRALVNSVILAVLTTVISIAMGASASYAFARLQFRGSKMFQFTALFFQLLPPIALLIPYYVAVSKMGMLDHLSSLILVNVNFVLVYVIWVMSNFFRSIPRDLENAARIDGCSWLGAYVRIALPNALPGFVAVGALSFLLCWDEFMYALVFTQSDSSKVITVAVSEFGTKFGIDYGMMMTAGVVATVIPMLFLLFFQQYIISGLTNGAVKE